MSQVGKILGSSCFVSPCPWGVVPKLGQGWSGHTACSPWPRADPSPPASKCPLLFAGAGGFGVQIAGSGTMGIVLPTMPLAPCRQALPDYCPSSALSIISCSNPPAVHTAGRAKPNRGAQRSPLPTATRVTNFSSPAPHPPALTLHARQSSCIHASAQPSLHPQTCPAQQSVLDGIEIQPPPRGWHCRDQHPHLSAPIETAEEAECPNAPLLRGVPSYSQWGNCTKG